MLHSAKNIQGYKIHSVDDEFGKVDGFFFDDEKWTVRYFVLDTRRWLPGRSVLISPGSVNKTDSFDEKIHVNLTKSQVKDSPDIDTQQPISRQHEKRFLKYYGYPYYWSGIGLWGADMFPYQVGVTPSGMIEEDTDVDKILNDTNKNTHLRSMNEVINYKIEASDGEVGHVDDFIVDDETWEIRYMVIDTGNWWPGKKILVSPKWITNVSWNEQNVSVELDVSMIKNGPEYDPTVPISREYENEMHDVYKKTVYWE